MYIGLHVKYLLFLSDLKLEFYGQVFQKIKYKFLIKIHPVGGRLFIATADRRDEANNRFSLFRECA